jgi:hypothetical protein
MRVLIKEFNVDMEVKNRGIELEVREPDGTHRGDLVLTKTQVIWCPGRTTRENGRSIGWNRLIDVMEDLG